MCVGGCGNKDCPSPFQRVQLNRASLYDAKRVTYQQTKKCSELMLLLGQVGSVQWSCDCHMIPVLYDTRLTELFSYFWKQTPPVLTIIMTL